MSRESITETFSDSDLRELLEYSKELLLTVDKIIEVTPIPRMPSSKQRSLRLLFMDARTASYDICSLAESLSSNDSHHFSRAIEYSMRFIWEKTIDYFYIFEVDDPIANPVAQRYLDFLDVVNTNDSDDRKERHRAFKQKYGNPGSDHWSGKTREDKVTQGLNKQSKEHWAQVSNVRYLFGYLNEQVHGNILIGLYWDFDKHGKFEYVYRGQVVAGLLSIWIFYTLSEAYCRFTGRRSEVGQFESYKSHVKPIFLRNRQKETTQ